MTSRRGFLGALAAALTLDPERALWVPGTKLISIAKQRPIEEVVLRVIEDVPLYGFGMPVVEIWPWPPIPVQHLTREEFARLYPPPAGMRLKWQ